MKRAILIAAALAACAWSGAAQASKQIKNKGPIAIDPALGYVMARVGPSASKGFAETILLFRIDPETSRLRTLDKKSVNPIPKGQDAGALLGGSRSFGAVPIKGGDAGVFLTSLTPGEWVVVGTQSTCACMGSYRFTVKAGEITDIGTIVVGVSTPNPVFEEFRGPAVAADLLEKPYTVPEAIISRPATETDAVPAPLARLPRTRAELTYTRFDNVGGWMVNRMSGLPPMGHETPEAAAALSDPRFPAGTSSNRWPDVNDTPDAKKAN